MYCIIASLGIYKHLSIETPRLKTRISTNACPTPESNRRHGAHNLNHSFKQSIRFFLINSTLILDLKVINQRLDEDLRN